MCCGIAAVALKWRAPFFPVLRCSPFAPQHVLQLLKVMLNSKESLSKQIVCISFLIIQGQWFYALMSCLEKPLVPEACSLLRDLARNCANLRATLVSTDCCIFKIVLFESMHSNNLLEGICSRDILNYCISGKYP